MSAEVVRFPDRRPQPAKAAPPRAASGRSIADLLEEWRDRAASMYGPSDEGYHRDDWINEHSDAMAEIEHEIAATPAASIEDALMKLRLQATTNDIIKDGETIADADAYAGDGELDQHLLLSALRDLERLMTRT